MGQKGVREKRLFYFISLSLLLLLVAILSSSVLADGIGSPDTECQNLGFDLGVAKWQCNESIWNLDEEAFSGTLVNGSCSYAFWSVGSSGADGIIVKADDTVHYAINGTSGFIAQSQPSISHLTFCGYNQTEPFCGDMVVNNAEQCELPNTNNNQYCPQINRACLYAKTAFRDNYGNCNGNCGCTNDSFSYQCIKGSCGAQCSYNSDCKPTECNHLDGCIGNDYYDYKNISNICNSNCGCTQRSCTNFTIFVNDSRCVETCQTNNDCNRLDKDYCSGEVRTRDEGKCINAQCVVNTTSIEDCGLKNGVLNDCGELIWSCSEELNRVDCVITDVDPNNDLCQDFCSYDTLNFGSCSNITFMCSYTTQNCNDQNGYYNTSNTRWVELDPCREKQQIEQEFRDYGCGEGVSCIYTVTRSQWIDTGLTRNKADGTLCNDRLFCTTTDVCTAGVCGGSSNTCSDGISCTTDSCNEQTDSCSHAVNNSVCNDGLFCNGVEYCSSLYGCQAGTIVDCSANNISVVSTCFNDPDAINYTLDFFPGFISECDEQTDLCTEGELNLTHTCDPQKCGAECNEDSDCDDYDSNTLDTCDLESCGCEHREESRCGDGYLNLGEECDDGNTNDGDGCSANCTIEPFCGDTIVNGDEDCELPNTKNNTYCDQETIRCKTTGNKNQTGVRDLYGNCNANCDCSADNFFYSCVPDSCRATCDSNDDCNDYDNNTSDFCNVNSCGCFHERIPRCGDGILDQGEVCDDGNLVNGDGCSSQCTLEACGDGIVYAPEECELPSTSNNNYCSQSNSTCSGNKTGLRDNFGNCDSACGCDFDSFNLNCVKNVCGATCDDNSDCNDYINETTDICNLNSCGCEHRRESRCGDGYLDFGEECDDGNQNNLDDCRNDCTLPYCGDEITDPGEECDDGNTDNYDDCRNNCRFPFCGDGIKDSNEECDDGNNYNGDGCSEFCQLEECDDTQDQDQDRVNDCIDQCPNSKPGEIVDENGCDIFQFCRQFSCGYACLYADFLHNEEVTYPQDCTIAIPEREGQLQQPICVPTEQRDGCAD